MNECGSLLDKTDTTGHLLVDSSPTGSPAANTLQKALGQLTLCHNNLKELLQRWRSDPAGVCLFVCLFCLLQLRLCTQMS